MICILILGNTIYKVLFENWGENIMGKFIVEKSKPLCGEVNISGSKNSVLPILTACILTKGELRLSSVPKLSDVDIMLELLTELGVECKRYGESVFLKSNYIDNIELDYSLVKKIRASFLLAGPLLARFGRVRIQMPGGCSIGLRPIDLHLKGFCLLGASYEQEYGVIEIKADRLVGNEIYLDFPSVGATENIMLAATMAEGVTEISNAATEPEIVDLANCLNKMGAKIEGMGTETIKITGVKTLGGCEHRIIPDRIEAGTFMIASAVTKGDVVIKNVMLEHLKPIIHKLKETNVEVIEGEDFVRVYSNGGIKNTDIKTMPYPGFPTDMQAQFMGLMALGEGTGIVNETVFENRFMHVGELNRMGADIKIEGNTAIIKGVERLTGTQVNATDLRAGAALIISALVAEGQTEIGEIQHIDRGYFEIEKKLGALGANIKRI